VADNVWLTVAESAAIAKCGKKLVYREIKAGRLRAARIGNRRDLRIHRTWIDDWLERSATPIIVNTRGAAASAGDAPPIWKRG
jgi:excisionase family DNA binding protein